MKYVVTLNGKNYEVEVNETKAEITAVSDVQQPVPVAAAAPIAAPSVTTVPTAASQNVAVSDGTKVTAPMPGTILTVNVSVGQAVKSGETVLVLEAMKMENEIAAPCDGIVRQLLVNKGNTVNTDDVLVVI